MMDEKRNVPSRFVLGAAVVWTGITAALWALAFAPWADPPVWLKTARAVCFGTLPNGLPDTYGWVSLVMGPLSMLAFLAVVWSRETAGTLHWLAARTWGAVAMVLFLLVPLVGLGWVGNRVALARSTEADVAAPFEAPEPLPASYPRGSQPAPGFTLVNQRGEKVTLDAFAGRPVFLTFAYAHCTTICPVIVDSVRTAVAELGAAAPQVVVVTLDPWRDTPGSLPRIVASWRLEGAEVLSGEPEEVLAVLEAWNVPIRRDEKTGEISHPALVYVLDGEGTIAYAFNGAPAGWLAEAARRVASG